MLQGKKNIGWIFFKETILSDFLFLGKKEVKICLLIEDKKKPKTF